jgi:hypothetical protein
MPRNQELHFGVIFVIFRNVKELIEEKTERSKVNICLGLFSITKLTGYKSSGTRETQQFLCHQ